LPAPGSISTGLLGTPKDTKEVSLDTPTLWPLWLHAIVVTL